MSLELIISLIIFSLILFAVTTYILKKGLIPAKYSLLWYFIALIILVVALCSPLVSQVAHLAGFETISNMIIAIILVLLIFLTMSLTIIVSTQRKKTTLLIQELSLLKSKQESNDSSPNHHAPHYHRLHPTQENHPPHPRTLPPKIQTIFHL